MADIEHYPDLLNEAAGNFQSISDSTGLITVTNYATATTTTTAGSVNRFVSSTAVMRGDRGTAVTEATRGVVGFGVGPEIPSERRRSRRLFAIGAARPRCRPRGG